MQINNISRKNDRKKRMIVGRGSKRGKTSGRGTKGQNSRAGHKKRPELRDLIKKLPKLRGRGKNSFKSFQIPNVVLNLDLIEKHFTAGATVSPASLVVKGLIEKYKGMYPSVKILAEGEITKKAAFVDVLVSTEAKAKIEKAGGTTK